jgi:hypothetical protein
MNINQKNSFVKAFGPICLIIALAGIWFTFKNMPLPGASHPYPMIRSGGLFLIMIGTGIILGAIFPEHSWHAFGISVFVGSVALTLWARSLTAPLGIPTRSQIGTLIIAVIVELIFIYFLPRFFPPKTEHHFRLLILLIVGVHFLIMTPAFGPLITIVGILTIINAGLGLRTGTPIAFFKIWGIDGILKLSVGAIMLCFPFLGLY